MKPRELYGWLAALVLLAIIVADRTYPRIGVRQLTAARDSAEVVRKVDSVEVVKWAVRTKTLTDTIDIHDTVQVKQLVQVAIGLRAAALTSVASASGASVAATNLIAALKPPRFTGFVEAAKDVQRPDLRIAADVQLRITGDWHAFARAEQTIAPNDNRSHLYVGGRYRFR